MLPKHEKHLSLYAAARISDDRPSPDQLCTYLIDWPYLNQKAYPVNSNIVLTGTLTFEKIYFFTKT